MLKDIGGAVLLLLLVAITVLVIGVAITYVISATTANALREMHGIDVTTAEVMWSPESVRVKVIGATVGVSPAELKGLLLRGPEK